MANVVDASDTRMTLRRLLRRPKYRYMVVNRIVPHLPWMVLFAMATFFYKARIFAESGLYFSEIINNKTFFVEFQRIVSGISQILPLIGIWIGVEFKYVLLIYSLSPVIFFYFLFLFVYYGLRDRRSGLLMILAQTVGIVHSFFIPVFELYYAVPLLITFYAIWRLPFRNNVFFILLLLEVLILLSHPLAFILFPYLLLYNFRKENAKPIKFYLPVILVFLGALAFRYFVRCDYQSGNLASQLNFFEARQYLLYLNPAYTKAIGIFLLRNYFEILLGLIIVFIMLVTRKQWFRLLLVTGTFFSYVFLVNSSDIIEPSGYLEQLMFPFVTIVFIPLIYGFSSRRRQGRQNLAVLFISALVVYRLALIYSGSEIFVKRVVQMEQLIETARQKGSSKFVISSEIVDHGYSQLTWSYPIETMLLSAIDANDLTLTIVPDKDFYSDIDKEKIGAGQFIYRKAELKDYTWLNKRYFHFDIGPYRTINDSTPNSNINYAANDLRITVNSKNIYPAMDTVWIPITIVNKGKTPVYSGKSNTIFLSYFWVATNDVLNWNEIRTPLQSDIIGTMHQSIKVAVPQKKGRMQLKVDIIANDNWLGIYSQENVLVY
ncbi:MAG: hypothetical protein Q7U54_21285 [Bacteroidales bacterium]|nr:hypothetical protein [Bacteroidales bacterium]